MKYIPNFSISCWRGSLYEYQVAEAVAALDFRPVLDEFGAPEGVQELLCDSFLQAEIPESFKYGDFKRRLKTRH